MVCVNHKALLGNHDNYRCFVGAATLDFPRDRNLNDVHKACTIARGQLMLQAQPENALLQWTTSSPLPRRLRAGVRLTQGGPGPTGGAGQCLPLDESRLT